MDYDHQYYLITEDECSGVYMLNESRKSDERLGIELLSEYSIKRLVRGRGHVHVTWGDDGNFSPCDYHRVSATGLVSHKFKEVLVSFNLHGVEFYGADIENNGNTWSDHYLIHIWQNYRVLHHGRSRIKGSYVDDEFTLEKISLDERVLDDIPIEERLVFRMNEDVKYLYHESVVAALRAAGLTGMRFVKVADWSIGSAFTSEDEEDEFYDDL
ncbi:imm11 family protein [Vibrio olivae]|uniref:Imm11 family protein n=1 Tax=Vibrio olivae TaxID=1243002 RepID=A0ABV5HM99_9VIBR